MDFKEYSVGEFDNEEQKQFRKEVREWIAKNISPSLCNRRRSAVDVADADSRALIEFGRKLAAKGWLTPEWPKEVGGAGLSADKRYIINQEVAARNIELPGHWSNFQGGVPGPTLMRFGTEEQKKEWLPKIAAGRYFPWLY